ncbi:hypothetical protein AB0B52_32590, partial [Streptomyces griseofuscus]|uniref:hypothetical protein n=1 Tax=Streptomyces griseofuscus TaxID=146922 RepID=UPI003409289E
EGNSLADAVKEQGRIEPREAARNGLWVLRALPSSRPRRSAPSGARELRDQPRRGRTRRTGRPRRR